MSEEEAKVPLMDHKVRLADPTLAVMHEQALGVGFHTSNTLSAIVLTTFSGVPNDKVFEALAMLRRYHRAKGKKGRA